MALPAMRRISLPEDVRPSRTLSCSRSGITPNLTGNRAGTCAGKPSPCLTTPDNCVGARHAFGAQRIRVVETDHAHDVAGLHLNHAFRVVRPALYPVFRDVPLQAVPHHPLGLLEGRRAIPDLGVRTDIVLDSKPVGPAHFLRAK